MVEATFPFRPPVSASQTLCPKPQVSVTDPHCLNVQLKEAKRKRRKEEEREKRKQRDELARIREAEAQRTHEAALAAIQDRPPEELISAVKG